MNTKIITLIIAGVVLIVIGFGLGKITSRPASLGEQYHAIVEDFPGIDINGNNALVENRAGNFTEINGRVFEGGTIWTTSTASTATSSTANVCDSPVWNISPAGASTAATTLYFPATTTLYADCLKSDGISFEVKIRNATTTGTGAVTLAKGWTLGTDLQATSSDTAVLDPGRWAIVNFLRQSITTTTVFITRFNLGD